MPPLQIREIFGAVLIWAAIGSSRQVGTTMTQIEREKGGSSPLRVCAPWEMGNEHPLS